MLPRRESSTLPPTTLDIPSRGGALRASCPLSNVYLFFMHGTLHRDSVAVRCPIISVRSFEFAGH
jgi:hypothetical protein